MCIDLLGKLSEEALARAGSTKEQAETMRGGFLYDQIELLWKAGDPGTRTRNQLETNQRGRRGVTHPPRPCT